MKNSDYPMYKPIGLSDEVKAILNKIRSIIKDVRKEFPEVTDDMLDEDGDIFYQNSLNGTRFDWEVNEHIPCFCVFKKDIDESFIRFMLNRNNTYYIWVYEDGAMSPFKEIEGRLKKGSAYKLFKELYFADIKGFFNQPVGLLEERL